MALTKNPKDIRRLALTRIDPLPTTNFVFESTPGNTRTFPRMSPRSQPIEDFEDSLRTFSTTLADVGAQADLASEAMRGMLDVWNDFQTDLVTSTMVNAPDERIHFGNAEPLTWESMKAAIDKLNANDENRFSTKGQPLPPSQINGLPVVVTTNAVEDSGERHFPPSRHRSARVLKKLIKRYGGVYKKRPACWLLNGVVYCHPTLADRLKAPEFLK